MEQNYILAKKLVEDRFGREHELYSMLVMAFFGFFERYPERKQMIIDIAYDTLFIFGNQPIEELAKTYDIDDSFVGKSNNDPNNKSICHGYSSPGYVVSVSSKDILIDEKGPYIICSLYDCGPTQLLDTFIHEFNHLLKCRLNCLTQEDNDNEAYCSIRNGLNFYQLCLYKDKNEYTEENAFSTLDECINVCQTTEIKQLIYSYKDIFVDEDIIKYLKTLKESAIDIDFGYEASVTVFRRLWANEKFRKILEANLINGDFVSTVNTFNIETYDSAIADLADYLDDIAYLEFDPNHKKEFEELVREANAFIDELNTKYTKQK